MRNMSAQNAMQRYEFFLTFANFPEKNIGVFDFLRENCCIIQIFLVPLRTEYHMWHEQQNS